MLLGRLPPDTFVTAFLGVLSRDSLSYCNAGHLPPLHVRAGSVSPLDVHGLPLGVVEQPHYSSSRAASSTPATWCSRYTDGLVEARRERRDVRRSSGSRSWWRPRGEHSPPGARARGARGRRPAWADGISDDAVALALRRAA